MIVPVIKLDNINENESANYRLIIIKGSIVKDNVICIDLNGEIECQISNLITVWPLFNGRFKSLVELRQGSNSIVLRYGDVHKEFNINWSVHNTDYCVVPVYLIPYGHNGCFQAPQGTENSVKKALERIGFGVLMIQSLFAEKLREQDYEKKSFQVESDINPCSPICHEFRSKLPLEKVQSWNEEELWEEVGRELMMSNLGHDKRKFICFISSTFWNGKEVISDPALGGGGLALLGSASLHSWPSSIDQVVAALTNDKPLDPCVLDNSCNRGTYSGLFATSLGSAAHEIGHIFNLGHTRSGLMARGFDNAHLVFIQPPGKEECTNDEACLTVPCGTKIPIKLSSQPFFSPDLTHLEPGCAAILAYHKWFNPLSSHSTAIVYDKLRHVIVSEGGLRVVEMRNGGTGVVRKSWVFRGSGNHHVLPTGHSGATLVAVDSNGTILIDTI